MVIPTRSGDQSFNKYIAVSSWNANKIDRKRGQRKADVLSDLTLTNAECEDRQGPKGLPLAEHVWMFYNGRSVYAVLYW